MVQPTPTDDCRFFCSKAGTSSLVSQQTGSTTSMIMHIHPILKYHTATLHNFPFHPHISTSNSHLIQSGKAVRCKAGQPTSPPLIIYNCPMGIQYLYIAPVNLSCLRNISIHSEMVQLLMTSMCNF